MWACLHVHQQEQIPEQLRTSKLIHHAPMGAFRNSKVKNKVEKAGKFEPCHKSWTKARKVDQFCKSSKKIGKYLKIGKSA